MSTKVMTLVFETSEATGNDRLVLLAIADEADDDGTNAFPSITRLAAKVRVPKRTVMRCLQRLEDLGELAVERPEMNGRGHFNRYQVLLGKGDTLTPDAQGESDEKRRAKARKGAPPRTIGDRPTDPLTPALDSESEEHLVEETLPVPIGDGRGVETISPIDSLCEQLATAIEGQGGVRPKITSTWRRDMRLLVERGPAGVDKPEPQTPERVAACIAFTFSHLAERGNDGFCWADQIQAPSGLRAKWIRLYQAGKKMREQHQGRGTAVVEQAGRRLREGNPLLGIFQEANQGGQA